MSGAGTRSRTHLPAWAALLSLQCACEREPERAAEVAVSSAPHGISLAAFEDRQAERGYSTWLIGVDDIRVGDARVPGSFLISMTDAIGNAVWHDLGHLPSLPAGRTEVSFAIRAPTLESTLLGEVDEADHEEMVAAGATHRIRGVIGSDGRVGEIDWTLTAERQRNDCENGIDGERGVALTAGVLELIELSTRLDDLFCTAALPACPGRALAPLLDADGGDGVVDEEDLAAAGRLDEVAALAGSLIGLNGGTTCDDE